MTTGKTIALTTQTLVGKLMSLLFKHCLGKSHAEEPGRLQSMGSWRVRHDWATSLSLFTFMHWRRKWQPTPVLLPGESQGRGAWWAAIYGVAQSRTQVRRLSSSRFVIAFFPRSKCLLISWLQSPSTVIWEPKRIKSATVSIFSPSVFHDVSWRTVFSNCGVGEDSWESLDWKEIKPGNPKGDQSWIFIGRTNAEAEALILWPLDVKNWFIGKDPDAGEDWKEEEKEMTEDEMVGWHHRHYRHESEQAPGVGDGQGGLACCSPWAHRVGHDWVTELNWFAMKWWD